MACPIIDSGEIRSDISEKGVNGRRSIKLMILKKNTEHCCRAVEHLLPVFVEMCQHIPGYDRFKFKLREIDRHCLKSVIRPIGIVDGRLSDLKLDFPDFDRDLHILYQAFKRF
jgi:hypothetical protein